ncbi:cytochrome b561 [Microthyrium microscopicum]|uniref:Cytochrome b561 n=1 Tax=Microthyrium microscopicum TaxID=703497 RepID=A0A6A6UGH2_9PEZI|nr:cytochrome b561 [Microthyrium microscopicum]
MASATGISEDSGHMSDNGEQSPLLGGAGDVQQEEDAPIQHNLILGTGIIAQAGIWILVALIWSGILSHPLLFFSPHPLLNSAAFLLVTQAALILQPTHTASQKRLGTYIHAILINLAFLMYLIAFVIIEINKRSHPETRFKSPHAIMGLVAYILTCVQWFVGATQFFYPQIYGGVDNAKKLYKYHRASGYFLFVWITGTICAATWTDYNIGILHIHHWSVITASVILLAGLGARIKKYKFGL